MLRIPGEFVDIPLRHSHVFEQFPDRVRQSSRAHAAQFGRNPPECGLPIQMSVASVEEAQDVLTQGLVIHETLLRSRKSASIGSLGCFGCRALRRASSLEYGPLPSRKQFFSLGVDFFDGSWPAIAGTGKHEIQNASPCAAVPRVGANTEIFRERHGTFSDPVRGADIAKNRVGALAVSLVEYDREVSGARSETAGHCPRQDDERNL